MTTSNTKTALVVGISLDENLRILGLTRNGDPPHDIHVGLYFYVAGHDASQSVGTMAEIEARLGTRLSRVADWDWGTHWNRPRVYIDTNGSKIVVRSNLNNSEWSDNPAGELIYQGRAAEFVF